MHVDTFFWLELSQAGFLLIRQMRLQLPTQLSQAITVAALFLPLQM